ncbi:Pleiotropic regulator 1 [Galemys pyrenaicus]|uniref:Pleiotropic regulator 1 n=1 Tax=Galemys pyrenaicus TaxID=202257 RepID=A0A8J6DDR5_GALPY|nr:Pleiotropic regulator 1 [Galemys pyrenaicus]
MIEEVQKHPVHALVFSLKWTHDNALDSCGQKQYPANQRQEVKYLVRDAPPYPPDQGCFDCKYYDPKNANQARADADHSAPAASENQHPGPGHCSQPAEMTAVMEDSTAQICNVRTKAHGHTLSGHANTVAAVSCEAAELQIISGSHDTTMQLSDLMTAKH